LEWVKAGVRAQRSKSRHRLDSFYDVKGLEAPPEEREMDLLIPPAPSMGNIAVTVENMSARDGEADAARWLFQNVTFSLKPGQCTGVVGSNGVGKTTLLRICMGERPADEGSVTIGKRVVFNYIDQARMELSDDKTVLEELSGGNEKIQFGERTLSARGYLRRFLFADERVNETVGKLSGGERARLMLAKVLRRGGNLLVLDEPTNDLDLPSLRMLEEALADFDGSVLLVSHDRYFLDRICDQIIAFEDGGIFVQPGNFSYYLEKRGDREARSRQLAAAAQESSAQETQSPPSARPRPRRISYMEKRELEGMEDVILEAETRVEELAKTLNDPDFYTTRAKDAPAFHKEFEEAQTEVARLYARWTELEALARNG
jgi:ATP-binding cassette subfamily F protein uup